MKNAYTLVEITIVLLIMGFLVALVTPKFAGVLNQSKEDMNEISMKAIKNSSIRFKNDTGFMPDFVSLLTYEFEKCVAKDINFDDTNTSVICKNMIAFLDSRYKINLTLRKTGDGDYGADTIREEKLIKIINEKLGNWKGGYLSANAVFKEANVKKIQEVGDYSQTFVYLSDDDLRVYYEGFDLNKSLEDIALSTDVAKKFFVISGDFSGSRGSGSVKWADDLFDVAKYRKNLINQTMLTDPWGSPYEIQFPTQKAINDAGFDKSRERFARLVSFGANKKRDTFVDEFPINTAKKGYDDSVLYLYEVNQTNIFHRMK